MVAVRIYADKQRIISTCDRELQSVKDVAELIPEAMGSELRATLSSLSASDSLTVKSSSSIS